MRTVLADIDVDPNFLKLTHIGLIQDSDGKLSAAKQRMGDLLNLLQASKARKGYFLFEPNLENIFLNTIKDTPQHQCWQQFEVCLEPHLDKINWHSKATALIYHALTFKPEEGAFLHYKSDALRTAIKTDPTLLQSPAFTALKTFLKNTFA
jgi:methionyl-tRNA formyltransferase